jgi:hypothetical protein
VDVYSSTGVKVETTSDDALKPPEDELAQAKEEADLVG